jgi:hypothetical protein
VTSTDTLLAKLAEFTRNLTINRNPDTILVLTLEQEIEMKVWIGYECYYVYSNQWRSAVKVFDDEVKALIWKEDFEATKFEWRSYEQFEVE